MRIDDPPKNPDSPYVPKYRQTGSKSLPSTETLGPTAPQQLEAETSPPNPPIAQSMTTMEGDASLFRILSDKTIEPLTISNLTITDLFNVYEAELSNSKLSTAKAFKLKVQALKANEKEFCEDKRCNDNLCCMIFENNLEEENILLDWMEDRVLETDEKSARFGFSVVIRGFVLIGWRVKGEVRSLSHCLQDWKKWVPK